MQHCVSFIFSKLCYQVENLYNFEDVQINLLMLNVREEGTCFVENMGQIIIDLQHKVSIDYIELQKHDGLLYSIIQNTLLQK